jgi:hypothetical protein
LGGKQVARWRSENPLRRCTKGTLLACELSVKNHLHPTS